MRPVLLAQTIDNLITLSNRGLVKRTQQELQSPELTGEVVEDDGKLISTGKSRFDGTTVKICRVWRHSRAYSLNVYSLPTARIEFVCKPSAVSFLCRTPTFRRSKSMVLDRKGSTLAMLWQQHSGCELAGLLQVGDLGAFPDLTRLDAATKKHASKDSDELGFANFCTVTPESQFYLQDLPSPPTYFVRGNHEDFAYLNTFTKLTPIDPWGKIKFIPDNQILEIDRVKIAAFGGIAAHPEDAGRGKLARAQARKAKQKSQTEPRFFSTTQLEDINPNFRS